MQPKLLNKVYRFSKLSYLYNIPLIRVYKSSGICILNNIHNNIELMNSNIFNKLKDINIETLVINNIQKNSCEYYIHKYYFPTIHKIVYFDSYDYKYTYGLMEFNKIFITKQFGRLNYGNENYKLSNEEKNKKSIYNPIVPNDNQFELLSYEDKYIYEKMLEAPILEEYTKYYKIDNTLTNINPVYEVLE
jgi:hypothetical protein